LKTRNGLVSNSSSSSFIIYFKNEFRDTNQLTKKQISVLESNGYKLCELSHPTALDSNNEIDWLTTKKQQANAFIANYGKKVICNQDAEIYILLQNKIPFIANVHYGQETYIYPKDSKYLFIFLNLGCAVEMYHSGDTQNQLFKLMKHYRTKPVTEKILVSKFIKQEEEYCKFIKPEKENSKI
jgi:hypothetical protein